jgi:hypothetical protein
MANGEFEVIPEALRRKPAGIAHEEGFLDRRGEFELMLAATREMQRLWRESPAIDPRSPDEILGYDENGLPA